MKRINLDNYQAFQMKRLRNLIKRPLMKWELSTANLTYWVPFSIVFSIMLMTYLSSKSNLQYITQSTLSFHTYSIKQSFLLWTLSISAKPQEGLILQKLNSLNGETNVFKLKRLFLMDNLLLILITMIYNKEIWCLSDYQTILLNSLEELAY